MRGYCQGLLQGLLQGGFLLSVPLRDHSKVPLRVLEKLHEARCNDCNTWNRAYQGAVRAS